MRHFLNCLLFFFIAKALAQPVDPVVVSGEAQFSSPALQQLSIKASHKAIINWKEFSIGLSELTQFIQPSKDSLVLNRVVGNEVSHILGRLEANGHVFLVNPQGIFFGKEAIIDVGGLTASTLAISDESFLKGEFYQFQKVSDQGIINYGTIRSAGGEVTLLGYQVVNEGKIEAKGGRISLGAGEEIILKPKGKQRIFIKPQPSEKKEEVGVHNLGKIEALKVELRSDGNPYKYAIRHEGVIDALQIQENGGEVFLTANKGKNQISGIITAASQEKKGGEIYLLGERIEVTKKARLNASGKEGGGKILIGGSRHGADPDLPHAKLTFIEEDAHMEANALEQGTGGEIVLWSDEATYFYGKMEARGGSKGGNGGFVEISSKKGLFPRGSIDRSAPHGKPGHLYWDPESDITISTHYSYNALSDDGLFTPIADVTNITIGDPMTPNTLLGELQKGPVTISTHFEGEGIAKGGIILSEDICHTYDSPHCLTLSSGGTKGIMIHGSLKNKGEGKIEVLSPQGDVKIFPKKNSQEAFLGTKGDLCLGKPSSPIGGCVEISSLAEKSGALKTEEHGHLFIYSQEGIFLESAKGAPATIETEKGNIHLHTRGNLKLTGKEGASAQIATLKGGSIFISGIDKQGLEHIYLLGKGGSAKITADPFSKT
ncbi:MAG: filamentous hemagglutinin N-terminal domain-containing protein, partial [Chlamydiales bacterium]|nr:filamentous hemagglutinin N-terminal domain-containing protein [Chlamydiales bacterium]